MLFEASVYYEELVCEIVFTKIISVFQFNYSATDIFFIEKCTLKIPFVLSKHILVSEDCIYR